MLKGIGYDQEVVLQYARQQATGRNLRYLDFEYLRGDCTNFVSQCIYMGNRAINYTPTLGWYYSSSSDKNLSQVGVGHLYHLLVRNRSIGPYEIMTDKGGVQPGDIAQLGNRNGYYHSLIIMAMEGGRILVAAHSYDAYMHPLDPYVYEQVCFIHIQGAHKW